VCGEEGCKTASRIHCGRLIVGNSGEAQQFEPELCLIVHKGMPCLGIFLDIMGHECTSECAFQLVGDPLLPSAHAAVAANNGASCVKETVDIGRKLPTLVDARR